MAPGPTTLLYDRFEAVRADAAAHCPDGNVVVGAIGGTYRLASHQDFTATYDDLSGPNSGTYSGDLVLANRMGVGVFTPGPVAEATAEFTTAGAISGSRAGGFIGGSWIRISGSAGVFAEIYGDCDAIEIGDACTFTDNTGDAAGFIDCALNCSPAASVGDAACDDGDGAYHFDCETFERDGGDCVPIAGAPGSACTVLPYYDFVPTYPAGVHDCGGLCYPAEWIGDGLCDDDNSGLDAADFLCEALSFDLGDCEP